MAAMQPELAKLSNDLIEAGLRAPGRMSAALGDGADRIAATARNNIQQQWPSGAKANVEPLRPRTARKRGRWEPAAFVFVQGQTWPEFPTRRRPATPAIQPAVDQHEEWVVNHVADRMADFL